MPLPNSSQAAGRTLQPRHERPLNTKAGSCAAHVPRNRRKPSGTNAGIVGNALKKRRKFGNAMCYSNGTQKSRPKAANPLI
jgi:hypothetical protein